MSGRGMMVGVLLTCWAGSAVADGGFFPVDISQAAESADQRAIVVFDGQQEKLVLQTGFRGDAAGFAWVIPTPTQVIRENTRTVDPYVFTELGEMTNPTYLVSTGGMGCWFLSLSGCSAAGGSPQGGALDVVVWDTWTMNGFDFATLTADDSADLATWLTEHGYQIPEGAAAAFGHYAEKDWFFTAVRVSLTEPTPSVIPTPSVTPTPGATPTAPATSGPGEEMPAVALSFETDAPVFPLRISQVSTQDEVELLLFVLAPYRVTSPNFEIGEMPEDGYNLDAEDMPAEYNRVFEQTLARLSGAGLIVEYASYFYPWGWLAEELGLTEGETLFLTRLRTRLQPADMADDIQLAQAPSNNETRVFLYAGPTPEQKHHYASVGMLVAACALAGLRWRRRGAATGLLIGLLLALAVV